MQVVVSISFVTVAAVRIPGAGGVVAEMRTISRLVAIADVRASET
jgi:hypothetical protein